MLLKLAIRAAQMLEDLSQLMEDKAMEATLEKLMKMIVEQRDEMMMLRSMNQRMEKLSIDVKEYMIQMLDQQTQNHITLIYLLIDIMMLILIYLLMDILILLKMLLNLLMKKLKILTLTYLLMDMTMMLNVNIKFYLLLMI